MADFFENINALLTKEILFNAKKILNNPSELTDNIMRFLNKNNIDLNNLGNIVEKEKSIICDPIEEDLNKENNYEILFLRLSNIENTMVEIQKYLEKDN